MRAFRNFQPAVAGLPEQILLFRDNPVMYNATNADAPAWDLSLNNIPIPYPAYPQVPYPIKPLEKQFWRVANLAADTILNLQLLYDGEPQQLVVVGLDGVPFDYQQTKNMTSILLGPMQRAEFIIEGPSEQVQNATLVTLNVNTGLVGDNDPTRPLVKLIADPNATESQYRIPPVDEAAVQKLAWAHELANAFPTNTRSLYFSEQFVIADDPEGPTNFYLTVDGQQPKLYDANEPSAIITNVGLIEDWNIENRSEEDHIFHIHQVHFVQILENGIPVAPTSQQQLDTIRVPGWTGTGPFPSVKVRMDFTDPNIAGTFLAHCHISAHEDGGMMIKVSVEPVSSSASSSNRAVNFVASMLAIPVLTLDRLLFR